MSAWDASAAFTRLVEALERHGSRVTGSGRQRNTTCPGHDDTRPSLSVTDGEARVLVRCHAGCDTDDLLAALGLTRADLFDAPRERGSDGDRWAPWQRDGCPCAPLASYDYVDEAGVLLYQVVRGEHKEFAQRRPDSSARSGWRWSLGDTRRVLYHLPRILSAGSAEAIWIAEGEKDVHALEAAGEFATCNSGGAGKWLPGYAESLIGRDVLVVADKDTAGRQHAQEVAASLEGKARTCWIVEAAEGKDAADHLAADRGITDFVWWSR